MSLAVIAAFAAALGVLVVPGLPLVVALRPRPLTGAALLAPASLVVVAVSAEGSHALGWAWSLVTPVVVGLIAGALVLATRRIPARAGRTTSRGVSSRGADDGDGPSAPSTPPAPTDGSPRARTLAGLLGLLIGGAVIAVRALHGMGGIDAISQTYDNIFHLGGVRAILDAHDASAAVVSTLNLPEGRSGFYPAGWHQLASLVVMTSGQSLPLASNALMLLVGAVVWPIGIVALVAGCTRVGPAGLCAAGALTGASFAFPLALMTWGLLLPNFLSTAMLPTVVLVAAQALGLAPRTREHLRPLQLVIAAPVAACAVLWAHPQGLHASLVLVAPMALWATVGGIIAWVRGRRRVDGRDLRRRFPLFACGASLVLIALIPFAWTQLRPSRRASAWPAHMHIEEALRAGLGMSGAHVPPGVLPALLMGLAMLVVLVLSRSRWMLPPLLATTFLFVAAAAFGDRDIRYLLTGPWYIDSYRPAALIPVLGIPVLAVAIDVLARAAGVVLARASARTGRPGHRAPTAGSPASAVMVAVCVLGLLVPAVLSSASQHEDALMARYWKIPQVVSADELAVFAQADALVPPHATIIADPWDGGSLLWALEDRRVLAPTPASALSEDDRLLLRGLGRIDSDPAVCDAAARQDARYVFTSTEGALWRKRSPNRGPEDAARNGSAIELHRVGKAALWELRPCRGSDGRMELTGDG
ncbi:hypothetical protein Bra3105_07715 [Brachybacterium halotolerans subsp. kimchii]|uniref:DUF6541 family protein n=1 Tax=Brachybacterium halotolerans TaxID=2795215 RepID=UPI001E39DA1E|nr:DUF6541 family protein [Brachybacterium halotolerans]UEJ84179.1 hypothetical protein Bra3105_07715 [Brachybacterium halotolerans subsp. kimchii]